MSKYKLINSVTKTETICDKVTIDGFDYYVSDEETKWAIDETNKLVNLWFYPEKLKGFVLATNNPNIYVPKVVDEVEKLAHEYFAEERDNWGKDNPNGLQSPQSLIKHYNKTFTPLYKAGYNKSQETHSFSEEDLIEFAEWYFKETFNTELEDTFKSTKELLQLWKEQRPKTVYYE